jgi:hypothetical protein
MTSREGFVYNYNVDYDCELAISIEVLAENQVRGVCSGFV